MNKIQQQFDKLGGEFGDLTDINESPAISNQIKKWRSSCLALLERAFGSDSQTTKEFASLQQLHRNRDYIDSLRANFLAAKADYEIHGSLPNHNPSKWEPIIEHWWKAVGTAAIIGLAGWMVGSGQNKLSEAEKHDVWKQLRSDDGDDGFVHAVSKRVQSDLAKHIKALDKKIDDRKAELDRLRDEIRSASISSELNKFKGDVKGLFKELVVAIGSLQNMFNDSLSDEGEEFSRILFELQLSDFKDQVEKVFPESVGFSLEIK